MTNYDLRFTNRLTAEDTTSFIVHRSSFDPAPLSPHSPTPLLPTPLLPYSLLPYSLLPYSLLPTA
jgi:hypothetical protein